MEKDTLESLGKGNKLAAHLALATSDEESPKGECLTPDELADVAAGLCTPEQRENAIAHFSSCRTCYDNWVAVSFSLAALERGSTPVRRSLFTVRNLGYLGSAFAVAASVVVFLNIRDGALESEPPPQQEVQKEAAVGKQEVPAVVHENKNVKADGPSESPPAVPAAARERSADKTYLTTSRKRQLSDQAVTMSAEPAGAAGDRPVQAADAAEWLERVYKECGNPPLDHSFWQKLNDQGREVLAGPIPAKTVLHEQRVQVEEVVRLLDAVDGPDQIPDQCGRIRRFLAQESDKE